MIGRLPEGPSAILERRARGPDGRIGEARSAYQTYVAAMDDLAVKPTTWDNLIG